MKRLHAILASALLLSGLTACQQNLPLSFAPQSAIIQAQSTRVIYHVVPAPEGWAVKEQRNPVAVSTHRTKAEAVAAGRVIAKSHTLGQLIVHRANGTFETEYTYGKDPRNIPG